MDVLRKMAMEIWKPKGKVSLSLMDRGFILIKPDLESDRRDILNGGPWIFGDKPMKITRWRPGFNPHKELSSKAIVWPWSIVRLLA